MNLVRTLALFCALGLYSATSQAALFVFGDSLSDVGNVLQGSIDAGLSADPPPPYAPGRMSNGPIWTDQLADRFGVARPTASLLGGNSFAYAGAQLGKGQTLRSSVAIPGQKQWVDNIGKQIDNFAARNPAGFQSGDQVLFWGGANDLLYGALAVGGGATSAATVVNTMLTNTLSDLLALANYGATRIVLLDQIDASSAPIWNGSYGLPAALQPVLSNMTSAFNAGLRGLLSTLELTPGFAAAITLVPVSIEFQKILDDPDAYGFNAPAALTVPSFIPGVGQVLPADGRLFWDPIHPTSAGHTAIANAVLATLPEPGSAALVLLAVTLLALFAGRRQRLG